VIRQTKVEAEDIVAVEDGSVTGNRVRESTCAPSAIGWRTFGTLVAHHSGINSRQVRPLVQIASITRQRQVVRVLRPTMLPSNDVFDMERRLALPLMEQTVLAPVTRASPHQLPGSDIHPYNRLGGKCCRAFN
jgi:hypothetical protein